MAAKCNGETPRVTMDVFAMTRMTPLSVAAGIMIEGFDGAV